MAEWKPARYGSSEGIEVADSRGRLTVYSPVDAKGETRLYCGSFDLHISTKNVATREEARRAILVTARKRLSQALAEVEEMLREGHS